MIHVKVFIAAAAAAALGGVSNPAGGAYISAAAIASGARVDQAPGYGDVPLRVVASGEYRVGVFEVHRGAMPRLPDGKVEEPLVMDLTVLYHVVRGSGTLVTGGTLTGGHAMAPGDPDAPLIGSHARRGSGIRGGVSQVVSAGDIVIVPAGVPHGFSAIARPITYLSIRMDPHRELPLK